jgi:hypothetical protein
MSIRAYVSAIGAADVLPRVLWRPIAEYARHDNVRFIAEVIGRGYRYNYIFAHDGIDTYINIYSIRSPCPGQELHIKVWSCLSMVAKDMTYDQLATAILESRINSRFRETRDIEQMNVGICHLHAEYLLAIEGEG